MSMTAEHWQLLEKDPGRPGVGGIFPRSQWMLTRSDWTATRDDSKSNSSFLFLIVAWLERDLTTWHAVSANLFSPSASGQSNVLGIRGGVHALQPLVGAWHFPFSIVPLFSCRCFVGMPKLKPRMPPLAAGAMSSVLDASVFHFWAFAIPGRVPAFRLVRHYPWDPRTSNDKHWWHRNLSSPSRPLSVHKHGTSGDPCRLRVFNRGQEMCVEGYMMQ